MSLVAPLFARSFPMIPSITLFRPIVVLCGTDNTMRNIFHIQPECEEYCEFCQFHITLLWV